MKFYFFLVILLLLFSRAFGQVPTQTLLPNQNSLTTTFNLFTDTLSGTCFTTIDSSKEYIVTARHLFKKATKSGDSVFVKLNINKNETRFNARLFFHPNPLIDVAILKIVNPISTTECLLLKGGDNYFVGQECIFLGYPLFNLGTLTLNHKAPFIKRAVLSALYEENGINLLLLDGHNNPGFSGGPIITYSDKIDKQFIFGIVSGYIPHTQHIQIKTNETDSLKQSIQLNENSGIIIAYPSKYITETIRSIH